jgi:hypothetical protein
LGNAGRSMWHAPFPRMRFSFFLSPVFTHMIR